MRIVNIKSGAAIRLDEAIGNNNYSQDPSATDITSWSIQSAMASNISRVAAGCVADESSFRSCGRVVKGLQVTSSDSKTININGGYGFTPDGKVISIQSIRKIPLSSRAILVDNTYEVYLKYVQALANEKAENQIASLPAHINQLKNLKQLSLSDNQLTSLPAAISQLEHLFQLSLEHNPLPIPPEMLKKLSVAPWELKGLLQKYPVTDKSE